MKFKSLLTSAALSLSIVALSGTAGAGDLAVVTFPMPPMIVNNNGVAEGPVSKFVQELLKGTGASDQFEVQPLARVHDSLASGGTLGYPISRTPEREGKYKFVVELYAEGLHFATLPPNKPVNTLDEARKLASIGVSTGSVTHAFLKNNNFTNIETVSSTTQSAAKIYAGNLDAWFATKTALRGGIQEHGQGKPQLNIGASVGSNPMWLVASQNVPDDAIEKIRKRFEELKGSASYQAMLNTAAE